MDFRKLTEDERDTLRISFLNTFNDPTVPMIVRNKAQFLYDSLVETEHQITNERRIKEVKHND